MTTRVLVLSDTHLILGARLPDAVLQLADRADHILHAGDLIRVDVIDTLAALAPITAVTGNVDDAEVAARLPVRCEVDLAGIRFGVLHDAGPEGGRHDRLAAQFLGCDVIVYGHTHIPELAGGDDGRPLIVNPGSPTQRRRAPWHSVAWLEIEAEQIESAALIQLDDDA